MQNTLDIVLPEELTLLEQIEIYIQNPPSVMDCPRCGSEYFRAVEREFLAEFGMCLGCDKQLCDTVDVRI